MWSKRHLARVENKKPFFDMKRGRGEIQPPIISDFLKLNAPTRPNKNPTPPLTPNSLNADSTQRHNIMKYIWGEKGP